MNSNQDIIYVYPTKESVGWIIGYKGYRIKNVQNDTHTNICFNNKNNYFTIKGMIEDIHQARIIIQDLEKSYYRKNFYTELHETEKTMSNTLKILRNKLQNISTFELQ